MKPDYLSVMVNTGPLGKLRAAATAGEVRLALSRLEALVAAGDYDALRISKKDVVETCEQWRNAHDKKHWNRTVAVVLGQCLRAIGKAGGGGGGGGGGGRGAATVAAIWLSRLRLLSLLPPPTMGARSG